MCSFRGGYCHIVISFGMESTWIPTCHLRRCMMTIFYGFEVRSGVARSGQQPTKTPKEEAEEATADYSKDYKD